MMNEWPDGRVDGCASRPGCLSAGMGKAKADIGCEEQGRNMLNERKMAQMAAFFLAKTPGKRMPYLKLMKLLYLSDREAMRTHGRPMTGDRLVSMPHGPVLSQTLDLMAGHTESRTGAWEEWVADQEAYELSLRRSPADVPLDELSAADRDVLNLVWQRFGAMGKWQIRDWTHTHCPEWQDPQGSSLPISYGALAQALGFDAEAGEALAGQIAEDEAIDRLFASL